MRIIKATNSPFNEITQLPDTANGIFDSNAAKGDVVFSSADGHVDLAQANADPQARAIGLATAAVVAGQSGEYLTSGIIDNEAWSLTPGEVYFLDPSTPGGITATMPTTMGQYVIIVGLATTPTQLNVQIHWMVRLDT